MLGLPSCAERHSPMGWSYTNNGKARRGLGRQPLPSDLLFSPTSLKLTHQEKVQTRTTHSLVHLGLFFTWVVFSSLLLLWEGRQPRHCFIFTHLCGWHLGFWLFSACLVCREGVFSKQFHYLAVLVTLKTQVNYNGTLTRWLGTWGCDSFVLFPPFDW